MADTSDIQSSMNEQKNNTTFRRENYSFVWRIPQFGECVERNYKFCSPTYCPPSEQKVRWKMMMLPMDIHPKGKHVALRLMKVSNDANYHSVVYTMSIIDENGKRSLMQNREKVFRHCQDFDEISVIDKRILKENNLFSNGFLTINCNMDVLVSDNPEHFSGTTSSQGDIPSVTDMSKCEMPTAFEKKSLDGALQVNAANSNNDSSDYRTSESLELLSEDFKSLYLNELKCDIVIRVSDGELQAHKAVLFARSLYFRQVCINHRGFLRNPEIYISEIKKITMESILYYLYTGQLRHLTFEIAKEILAVCERLRLPLLEKMIQNFLKTKMDVNNVIDIFKMSIDLKMEYLKNSALMFMSLNHKEVSKTEKWQEMIRNDPDSEFILTVASFKRNVNYNK